MLRAIYLPRARTQLGKAARLNGAITDDPAAFATMLSDKGRLVGLDLGSKTIGLALSDELRVIASPYDTIRRTKFSVDGAALLELFDTQHVTGVVLGLPNNMDGSAGPRVQATRAFARNLAAISPLPQLLWDERLTTAEAERMLIAADTSRQKRREVIDKVAAALILQNALERLRSGNPSS